MYNQPMMIPASPNKGGTQYVVINIKKGGGVTDTDTDDDNKNDDESDDDTNNDVGNRMG